MDIGGAILLARAGHKVSRSGWNGKGMFVYYVGSGVTFPNPDQPTVQAKEFVAMHTADGSVVPWLCSQSDLLADDWEIVAPVLQLDASSAEGNG